MPASPYGPGGGAAGTALANLTGALSGAGGAGSGTAFVDPSEPVVRLDFRSRKTRNPVAGKPLPGGGRVPSRMTVDDSPDALPVSLAQQSIYSWPEEKWRALAKRLWFLGYKQVSDPDDIQGAIAVWQDAVAEAAKMQAGGHTVTPDDVLALYAGANADTAGKRGAGELQSSKQRSISLTDPVQARAFITQAFQQAMGRDPTDAEVRVLTDSLHREQRANPTVSESKPIYDDQGNPIPGQSETVTTGGVDPTAFIQQAAMDDPEAAQYQAGTYYFNTLMKALSSPVG